MNQYQHKKLTIYHAPSMAPITTKNTTKYPESIKNKRNDFRANR
jgi:hypothetical protein